MIKLSVIIPAYNAGKTIEKAIFSILHSDLENYEIIVINDGSKDNTGQIVKNIQKNNLSLIYIEILNGGVSNARNIGINSAHGKYILFLDSDDSYYFYNISKFNDLMNEDYDLILFDFQKNVFKENKANKLNFYITRQEFINNYYFTKKYFYYRNYVFGKLLKKDLIQNNGLHFDTNICYGEDTLFISEYLIFCKRVYMSNSIVYLYNTSENALSQQMNITYNAFLKNIKNIYFNIGVVSKQSIDFLIENYCIAYYHFNNLDLYYFDDVEFKNHFIKLCQKRKKKNILLRLNIKRKKYYFIKNIKIIIKKILGMYKKC